MARKKKPKICRVESIRNVCSLKGKKSKECKERKDYCKK